jgi:hypothetical protein
MMIESFTSEDQGLRPVELRGSMYHRACAEYRGMLVEIWAYQGGERYADYIMDSNPELAEHEYCCAACCESFPQITVNGEWI